VSKGFLRGKTYTLRISSSSSPTPVTWVTSIEVSDTGSLTVGRVQNQPVEPSKLSVTIEQYNKGEFFMIEVVSEDGTVYSRERVHPFPIEARNGECRVFAELVTKS